MSYTITYIWLNLIFFILFWLIKILKYRDHPKILVIKPLITLQRKVKEPLINDTQEYIMFPKICLAILNIVVIAFEIFS
jgi:hypothetical protein